MNFLCPSPNLEQSQESVYHFILSLIEQDNPEGVLREFRSLFLLFHTTPYNRVAREALSRLLLSNNEQGFLYLLKRSCYILVNNWSTKRYDSYILQLITSFQELNLDCTSRITSRNRLQLWLKKFISSQDYQDLRLFANRHEASAQRHWSERYSSYLLVAQSVNASNPQEQREAARLLADKLQQKFKFDLAMYTAHSQFISDQNPRYLNPTSLGDEVLVLMKLIVAKKGLFNYENIANIFLRQTEGISYQRFKLALIQYLQFDNYNNYLLNKINTNITSLYPQNNAQVWNRNLLLLSSKRVIDYLTIDNNYNPSELFILFAAQNSHFLLVITLLKIILICPNVRIHLEKRIAELIKFYHRETQENCQWLSQFIDLLNLSLAIYADQDVRYHLLQVKVEKNSTTSMLDRYHIFPQYIGERDENSCSKSSNTLKLDSEY